MTTTDAEVYNLLIDTPQINANAVLQRGQVESV